MHHFTIHGLFRPYTRMTQKGKFVSEAAKAYLASQDRIKWLLKAHMRDALLDMLPS